jgi:alpha-glucosidase
MEQVEIASDRVRDPFEKLVTGYGLNRDPERTPMRWDGGHAGGFTSGEPWLPMGKDVAQRNVERLKADEHSLLALYRELIALRRREPLLIAGDHVPVRSMNDILAFKRTDGETEILVALNLVHQPRRLELPLRGTLLLSSYLDGEEQPIESPILLRPDEGLIIRVGH